MFLLTVIYRLVITADSDGGPSQISHHHTEIKHVPEIVRNYYKFTELCAVSLLIILFKRGIKMHPLLKSQVGV